MLSIPLCKHSSKLRGEEDLGGISISFFDYQINCLPSKNFWEIMVRLGTVLKVKTYSRFTRELAHFKVWKFDRPWSFCFSGILACFTACFLTFTVAFFIPPGLKACEVDVWIIFIKFLVRIPKISLNWSLLILVGGKQEAMPANR